MANFDYGAVKLARQVIPGGAETFDSKVDQSGKQRVDSI